MAIFDTSRPAPTGAIATFKLVSAFDRVISAVLDWNTERKTVAVLNKLTDHDLEDIGLSRGDIRGFAARR